MMRCWFCGYDNIDVHALRPLKADVFNAAGLEIICPACGAISILLEGTAAYRSFQNYRLDRDGGLPSDRMRQSPPLLDTGAEGQGDEVRQPSKLTERQKATARMLAMGKTITDAAHAVGVARQTLSRWVNHNPGFAAEVDRLREEIWQLACRDIDSG